MDALKVERCIVPREVVFPDIRTVPSQYFGPETVRMYQRASMDRQGVVEAMIPGSLAVNYKGSWVPVMQFGNQLCIFDNAENQFVRYGAVEGEGKAKIFRSKNVLADVCASWTIPRGAWTSGGAIMFMSEDFKPSGIVDMDSNELATVLRQTGIIIEAFGGAKEHIYFGSNYGPGNAVRNNFQSVLFPHFQICRPDEPEKKLLTINSVRDRRRNINWDGGLSYSYGAELAQMMEQYTIKPDAKIIADNMGLTILLPGFQPNELNIQFFHDMIAPLITTAQNQLREYHQTYFGVDLDHVINTVKESRTNGVPMTDNEWNNLLDGINSQFILKEGADGDERVHVVRELLRFNIHRNPACTAFGILFNEEGALVSLTYGFREVGGVAEGWGLGLERPPTPAAPQVMEQNIILCQKAIARALAYA